MFNSSILEVAMGMIFLYVLLSLLCSAAKEMISHILDMRAKNLEDGLTNILRSDKDQLVSEVYEHALIQGLSNKKKKPNYISSRNFALALMDVMSGNTGKIPNDIKSLMEAIDKGPFKDTPAAKSVILLLNEAGKDAAKARDTIVNDATEARESIETWFNNSMHEVGDWYKRKAHTIIFFIALITCTAMNIDSIKISQTLLTDNTLRSALVEAAAGAASESPPTLMFKSQPESVKESGIEETSSNKEKNVSLDDEKTISPATANYIESTEVIYDQIRNLQLPIGWHDQNGKWITQGFTPMDWFMKFMGILITIFAASLGAPFWFQLLNKIVDLRAATKVENANNSSKD